MEKRDFGRYDFGRYLWLRNAIQRDKDQLAAWQSEVENAGNISRAFSDLPSPPRAVEDRLDTILDKIAVIKRWIEWRENKARRLLAVIKAALRTLQDTDAPTSSSATARTAR